MSKKMNLKSMNLDHLNGFCRAEFAVRQMQKAKAEALADPKARLDEARARRELARQNGTREADLPSILAEEAEVARVTLEYDAKLKPLRARMRDWVKLYGVKADTMYISYSAISGSDLFAKDLVELLESWGAKINDPRRAARQVAHITGWSKKNGRLVPLKNGSPFVTHIFLALKTMLTEGGDSSLCVETPDGGLMFRRDLGSSEN